MQEDAGRDARATRRASRPNPVWRASRVGGMQVMPHAVSRQETCHASFGLRRASKDDHAGLGTAPGGASGSGRSRVSRACRGADAEATMVEGLAIDPPFISTSTSSPLSVSY